MFRVCKRCKKEKEIEDYYVCRGVARSECKACTIKRNSKYQKKVQAWKKRFSDPDRQNTYMREYYARNKEKFAEYRRVFKENHPDYHKDYARDRKNKKGVRESKPYAAQRRVSE